jgi:hypothetical protein
MDTAQAPIGDDEHDFLNPDLGCQWDQVFNDANTVNLPFQTRPDTLIVLEDKGEDYKIYPAWNDDGNLGDAKFAAGEYLKAGFYDDKRYMRYKSKRGQFYPETHFVAYGVEILDQEVPMFAADHITVIFVPSIEYPTIDQSTVPSHVDRGEEFTIRLKGDVDLMKSWIPEFQVSGVEYEIMNADMHSVTIKATSGGQMNVTLKHKSLLVFDDETVNISVKSDVPKPLAPKSLVATAVAEGHKLTWQSVDNAETYNVYRREDWKQYYEELASGLVSVEYIDDEKLPNDTYRYVVTAVNESGESGNSNEVIVVVTSIEDYLVSGSQIETYPNPTDGKLGVRLSLQDKRRVDFRIYDLEGKIVLSKTEMGKEIVTEMELESQTSGVYIMEIEINGTKKTIKIMKK